MPFQYDLKENNNISIITIIGELRIFDLADYTSFFDEQIAKGSIKIVINFAKITYIDSTAIGLLVNIKRNVEELGGRLVISSVQPNVMNVLQITGIDQFLDIYSTISDAEESFA